MKNSFYSVYDFGARGDGITLDTAAIQSALDACKAEGGTVLIPVGDYVRHASDVSVINTRVRREEESLRGIERFALAENRPKEYEHLWREDMMPNDKFPCVDAYDVSTLTLRNLDATGHRSTDAVRTRLVEIFTKE